MTPFYESSVEEYGIVDESITSELTEEELEEFRYMNNFFKRHNKVLLDKMVLIGSLRQSRNRSRL